MREERVRGAHIPLELVMRRFQQNDFTQLNQRQETRVRAHVERITSLTRRVETLPVASFSVARTFPAPIGRRSGVQDDFASSGTGHHGSEVRTPQSASRANRGTFAAEAAPALNLESLTDQVVRQIDRRMVAWRERMGRI
jgi:hypothetical protein